MTQSDLNQTRFTWTTHQVLTLCEASAKVIKSYYGSETAQAMVLKIDESPVTQADLASDRLLRAGLSELEAIPILSEETIDDGSRFQANRIWLVDPLDGTKDFIAKTDEFAINIALIEAGRPIFGAIYIPMKSEFYYAYQGQGAFLIKEGVTTALKVSEALSDLVLLKSRFSHSEQHLALEANHKDRISQVRLVGSCYKGCLIARGQAHGYYRFGETSEWDTAPMDLIVHEAGGQVRQLDGSLFTYNRRDVINRLGFYVINQPEALLL